MRRSLLIASAVIAALAGCQSGPQNAASTVPTPDIPTAGPLGPGTSIGPPSDVLDLVNAKAAGAETQMASRGYQPAKQQGLTAFWWNASTQTCAKTVTANGRYQTIGTATPSDCGL